ncbi:MAG: peptidylprolyl isomerase [Acidobacteriia bacterium]|nr:peptidylprolyl isomerase [Terriglobia bacterium]
MILLKIHAYSVALFLAFPLLLLAQGGGSKYPNGLYAEVTTNKGLIVLQLEFQKTPMTAANFVGLAEGTIKNTALPEGTPYFNGTRFHRVVPGHVIQTGIPANGKTQGPGYQFPNEIRLPDLNHNRAGMLNMANSGPHTNGSQWCIMLGDRSYLNGDYTVFGHVVQGLDVVFAVVQGDEVQSVKIVRVGAAAERFRPTTDSFQKMVAAARARVQQADAKKKAEEERMIRRSWPKATVMANGVKFVVVREGRGEIPAAGTRVQVSYSGRYLKGLSFVSTADGGKPYFGDQPEPFEFEVGKAVVNRGLDAAIAQMKRGEKRIVIVPPGQAYGTGGYYDREKPGQKRFHISPNMTLVYEVEIHEIPSR